MKKRLFGILLTAIMALSMLPALAFAEDGGEAAPACICETACTAEEMNADCPVCGAEGAFPENCGKYVKPAEDAVTPPEDGKEEPPECTCETACTVEAMNKGCPVCGAEGALPENCGKYVKPAEDAVTPPEDGKEEPPVCTCETACTAESMNASCPVCGAEGASAENCAKYVKPGVQTQPEGEPVTLNDEGETWTEIDQDYINNSKDSKNEVTLTAGSYRLTGNINLNVIYMLNIDGKVTLDLNGHELKKTSGADSTVYVEENAELTLVDGSEAQSGVIRRTKGEGEYGNTIGVYVDSGAAFIMNGGTIVVDGYCVSNNGMFTMNGGTIQGNGSESSVGVANRDKMYANGGTVKDCAMYALDNSGTVLVDPNASGTEFYSDALNGFDCAATISGGIFHGNVDNARYGTISGGTFNGYIRNLNGAVISGGVFNDVVVNSSDGEIQGTFKAGIVTGSGKEGKPYRISSAAQLKWFRDAVNSGEYDLCAVLTADIDLENEEWTPIGIASDYDDTKAYSGIFDGGGHTISGLNVTDDSFHAGLFGLIAGATIQDLSISGSVTGSYFNCGSIAGTARENSTIKNCSSHCDVTNTTGAYAGGVVGVLFKSATIIDCYNTGTIHQDPSNLGNPETGGIVGRNSGTIRNCYNVGSVSCDNETSLGSIAGFMPDWSSIGIVENCYYLDGTGLNAVGSKGERSSIIKTESKTAAEFADGTVLALLINGRTDSPWDSTCKYVTAAGKTLPVFKGQGDAHEHSGTWKSNGNGTHSRVCACGVTETANCSGGTATCTEKATCAVCGGKYGALGAHSFTETVDAKYLKSAATCTAKAVYYKSCAVCGEKGTETFETGNVLGHDWGKWQSNGDGTHTRVCKRDESHTETVNCSGGTATCTEKATCAVCGSKYGEKDPDNHTGKKEWTITKTKHEQKWSCCGEVVVAKESHTFGKWVVTKKATSKKEGEKTRTCEVCDYVEKATIQATGAPAKTGDESHIGMWAGILCVSLAGIIALAILYGKKHKK